MKVKVLKDFIDKYDEAKKYQKDDEIEVTKKRFKELEENPKGPYVEEIKEEKQEEKNNVK